jgi:hypothetical protein
MAIREIGYGSTQYFLSVEVLVKEKKRKGLLGDWRKPLT